MKKLLILAGVLEIITGVALMVVPALVGRLLLGAELTGVSIVVARAASIALLALGVACWPGTPLCGMLTYNALATAYFTCLAIHGTWAGPLLWPAAGLHAVLSIFLGRAWLINKKSTVGRNQTDQIR